MGFTSTNIIPEIQNVRGGSGAAKWRAEALRSRSRPGHGCRRAEAGHAATQQAATTSMSRGLRGRCGAGANRRPLAGGGASPSPSPARLAAVRGATRRREARAPPEVPCGADHASFLFSIRDRERLSALSTIFFFRKPGYIFKEKSDSLHHLAYKDTLQRKGNYKQVLVRSTSCSRR